MNPDIPTFTQEEHEYYDAIILDAAVKMGVPDVIADKWLCNNERSRMLWFFISKMIKADRNKIQALQVRVSEWDQDPTVQDYWVEEWTKIIEKLEVGSIDVLYEDSDLMQELRSHSPLNFRVNDKIRWKIITYINGLHTKKRTT